MHTRFDMIRYKFCTFCFFVVSLSFFWFDPLAKPRPYTCTEYVISWKSWLLGEWVYGTHVVSLSFCFDLWYRLIPFWKSNCKINNYNNGNNLYSTMTTTTTKKEFAILLIFRFAPHTFSSTNHFFGKNRIWIGRLWAANIWPACDKAIRTEKKNKTKKALSLSHMVVMSEYVRCLQHIAI